MSVQANSLAEPALTQTVGASRGHVVLHVQELQVAYGKQRVVHGASFQLRQGDIACLLGPSGCGKTTILRAIGGFERALAGEVRFNGRIVSSASAHEPPEARGIGMVFQDYALFPHLRVADNIAFGLRQASSAQRATRVAELLQLIGLPELGKRYPHELSGGQQQRVALARALAPKPDLILLDEPFSNLDVDLRERLSIEVRDILKHAGTSAILVTHDQHEAFAMADEIGVMEAGHIRQWDTAYRLYHQPASRFVADFVGQGVLVPGRMVSERAVSFELGTLQTGSNAVGSMVDILLRPDAIVHDHSSSVQAEVVNKAFRGAQFLYTLRLASGLQVLSLVASHHDHAIGERIGIRLEADHLITFPARA